MSSSRLDDLRMVDPVLTTIAQGYSNAAMVAEYLFPQVSVSKLKGKVPIFGRESFVVRNTNRAIRAQSNRIPASELSFVAFETMERDIEIAIDYIEEEESPNFTKYEQKITKDLMDILLLGREKEAADYVQNANNFINDLKTVLTEVNAFDDYENEIDPIVVIKDAMSSVRSRIGINPNTMILGAASYKALMLHPKILAKIQYSGLAKVNTALLSELCDIASVHVGMAVYSTDGLNFSDVWGDNIILAYSDRSEKPNRSEFNPSYGYTMQREGKPEVDSYYENGGKIKVIRNTDNYCLQVTASDAAYLISDTNHND